MSWLKCKKCGNASEFRIEAWSLSYERDYVDTDDDSYSLEDVKSYDTGAGGFFEDGIRCMSCKFEGNTKDFEISKEGLSYFTTPEEYFVYSARPKMLLNALWKALKLRYF